MSDKFDMSLDDILASFGDDVKESSAPKKAWSMEEIDALLGLGPDPEEERDEVLDESVTASKETENLKDFSNEKLEVLEYDEMSTEDLAEENPSEDYALEENEEPVEAKPKEKKPLSQKTRVFDANDIQVKKTDIVSEPEENVSGKPEETSIIMELADKPENVENSANDEEDTVYVADSSNEIEKNQAERYALAGKTVGIYPIRNDNIDHQIMTEKIEKSGGMVTDKYRERFLNKPKQHLERTADYERLHQDMPEELIERPGIIIKKSKFTNTADLEPIPTIVSADAERSNFDKTIVAKGESGTIVRDEDSIDGQIRLSGFGEEDVIDQIDEENAEETLREKRDKKVASFKLDANFAELPEEDTIDEESEVLEEKSAPKSTLLNEIEDEYRYPSDASRIYESLVGAEKKTGMFVIAQTVLTVISLIITGLISASGGNVEMIGNGALGCGIINIIILVIASVLSINTLIKGIDGIKNKKPNTATGLLVVVVACLLENIVMALFTSSEYTTVSIYTAAACLALTMSSISKWLVLSKTKGNFEFVTNGTQLYSSELIPDEDEAFEIGRGLLMGEPEICYNARISVPKDFLKNSFEDDPADDYAYKLVYAVVGAALLAGLIFGIVKKDIVVAFGIFAAVCCIAMPAFTKIASNISLFLVNRKFNKTGAAITGHKAVSNSTGVNAYVLDSTDIFKKGSCSIIGIKTFHNMRIDDAILYAAALVIESGGPLADIFGNVILGKKELLPLVESLAYEEQLGLSAWIHGRKVHEGRRDLLVNHNVQAPEREFELQYTHDGRKVMYLAIAGKIAAMFVINYQADKHMRRYLQNIDKAGVSLLVRTCDCNITEEMICKYFSLNISAVKILSPVSGDIFQKYRTTECENAKSGILHNGTIEASLKTIYEARELNANIPINNIISTIYTGIALVLFLVLAIFSGPMGITGGQIVLFQVLFGIIASAVPVLKRKFDK